jgi:hypothetical protein
LVQAVLGYLDEGKTCQHTNSIGRPPNEVERETYSRPENFILNIGPNHPLAMLRSSETKAQIDLPDSSFDNGHGECGRSARTISTKKFGQWYTDKGSLISLMQ